VQLVFADRVATLRLLVRGLRLARKFLTLPADFVNEFFSLHACGSFGAAEVRYLVGVVERSKPPAGAPPLSDVKLLVFRVQLPDSVNLAFIAWTSAALNHEAECDKLRDAVLRFEKSAPAALDLSTRVTWAHEPSTKEEWTSGVKDCLTGNLNKVASKCFVCGASARDTTLQKCSICSGARYCSKDCQKKDWRRHKGQECTDLKTILFWHGQTA
jgi:hypothetical protein